MAKISDEVLIQVAANTSSAIKSIKELEKQSASLYEKLQQAYKDGDKKAQDKFRAELKKTDRALEESKSRIESVKKTLSNISGAGIKDLEKTVRGLKRVLESGIYPKGSDEWKELIFSFAKAKQALSEARNEWKLYTDAVEFSEDRIGRFQRTLHGLRTGIGEASQGIKTAIGDLRTKIAGMFVFNEGWQFANRMVEEYAQIEQAYVDVTKYTGLTREEVLSLNEAFKRMDTATPRQRLNELAADAGRLGLQSKQEVLDFVEAANALNVALGEDLGQDAVKQIGKLADVFGDTQRLGLKQAMLSTGSAINELAQNSSAAEGYLVDFASRLGGIASQSGLTQAQVLGLGAAMDSAAIGAEISSTAISKILQKLYTNTGDFAARAGLNVEEFARLLRTDANEALLQFAEALQKKGGIADLAPLFADMHISGAGITQTLQTLAARSADVRTQQERATAAFQEGTSVLKEYDAQNNSVSARLQKMQERWADVRRELGAALLPVVIPPAETPPRF